MFVIVSLLFNYQMPAKVIDRIQMITVVGYDAIDQNKIQETVVSPKYQQEAQVEDFIYSDTAATVYENRVNLNAKATERLLNGKLQIAFYDRELAEQGVEDFIEYLTRDPSIGGTLNLAVAEESAHALINSVKTGKGRGVFFNDLFDHNIRHGNLPQTNLKEFQSALMSETCDPFLPMLSVEDESAALTAIALFDDDKYVDKLPINKADVFKLLYQNVSDGNYQFKNDKYIVALENVESDKDVVFEPTGGSGEVTFNVKLRGVVREYTGKEIINQLTAIEKDIKQDIEQRGENLISRLQELDIDPLDIEGAVKSSNRNYNKEQFKSTYSEMPINVNVSVKITGTGTRR
ncbi:Ger(x)C family spore germination protein [Lentibacillus amyloliquefaciens]|uniref:Ger(x)C family spore germination protein n=1 Tax=Lentibacillus amyloliquefaciens TaxID=1472767 RepID=UPI00146FEDFA|nr:Ger(x)C family spore germination protein [Lentibacillus amyloliquefaciens]